MKSKMGKMLFLTERPLQENFNIYNSGAEDSKLAERCIWIHKQHCSWIIICTGLLKHEYKYVCHGISTIFTQGRKFPPQKIQVSMVSNLITIFRSKQVV